MSTGAAKGRAVYNAITVLASNSQCLATACTVLLRREAIFDTRSVGLIAAWVRLAAGGVVLGVPFTAVFALSLDALLQCLLSLGDVVDVSRDCNPDKRLGHKEIPEVSYGRLTL